MFAGNGRMCVRVHMCWNVYGLLAVSYPFLHEHTIGVICIYWSVPLERV
jgi:hypothetical protein